MLFKNKIKFYFFKTLSIFFCIKKNKILFCLSGRNDICCNPKYIYNFLKTNNAYEMVWVLRDAKADFNNNLSYTKVLKFGSFRHFINHTTSKIIVYNDYLPYFMPKKKNQIYICTWHGGYNYKSIGYDSVIKNKPDKTIYELQNPEPDYYIVSCKKFMNDIKRSFNFSKTNYIKCGLPRNDLFFNKKKCITIKNNVKRNLGILNKKVLLYVPTFRDNCVDNIHSLDCQKVLNSLNKRFGGDWVLLFHRHAFVKQFKENIDVCVDVSSYADVQELIVSSDAVISDYSSIMWDASFTRIPIFVYAPDFNEYNTNERKTRFNAKNCPFPYSVNNKQLIQNILNFDNRKYQNNIKKHHNDACSYENSMSSNAVATLIENVMSGAYTK